jgi:hypothetical protein
MSNSTLLPGIDKQDWARATDKAKEAAAAVGEMAGHAASAVGAMASQAACDAGKKADELAANAGVRIQGLGDQLSKNTSHEGMLGIASQALANTVTESGAYLERAKLSGIVESIAHVIRQNPIPAVLIGIGLGWFAARKVRK